MGFMFLPINYPGQIQIAGNQVVTTNPKTGLSTIRMNKATAIERGILVASGAWLD